MLSKALSAALSSKAISKARGRCHGRIDISILRGAVGLAIGVIAMAWPGHHAVRPCRHLRVARIPRRRHQPAAQCQPGAPARALEGPRDPGTDRSCGRGPDIPLPSATVLALVIFIAAWAIVTGALELVAAIRLRKEIHGEWVLALSGVMSIVFGSIVFAVPGAGTVGIALILGMYAAASGIVLITLGVRMRTQLVAV